MENEKALVAVSGGALMESEVISEALTFAQKGFGGMPITLPKGYDVSRAVKNLCFALPNVVNIAKATKNSIMQAVHDYITQGLDVGKKQCALIVYGDKLTVQREYFGNVKIAKSLNPEVAEISHGTVIYAGEKLAVSYDQFGRTHINHEPDFSCWNADKIVGAYAVVTYTDGTTDAELMTIHEIKAAWAKSRNGDAVHKQFPVEMCKKTVLNRLCKKVINNTDDAALIDDIDERQRPDNYDETPVDIEQVQEYAEPEEILVEMPTPKPVEAPPIEEEVQAQGNPDDEDYCITISYKEYLDTYKEKKCATGGYNKTTKKIEVYPNRKKGEKKEEKAAAEVPEFL